MDDKVLFDRLFIAVPELRLDMELLEALVAAGVIPRAEFEAAKKVRATGKKFVRFTAKMRNKSLSDRIMMVIPEILSVSSVGVLSKFGLIDSATAHTLRLVVRAAGAAAGRGLPSDATILARMAASVSKIVSYESIDLIRALDDAKIEAARDAILEATGLQRLNSADAARLRAIAEESIRRAEQLRGALGAVKLLNQAVEAGKGADSLLKALYLIGPELLDPALVRQMRKAGLISGRTADIMINALALGKTAWRNFAKAAQVESLAARMLLISQGVITHEMLNFMVSVNILSPKQAAIMRPMVTIMRGLTRDKLDEILNTTRRYRVLPGESPIKTFARGTAKTDRAILAEIAKAAKEAEKEAARLLAAGGSGNRTRANQLRVTRAALHDIMHEMYQNVGTLTIFGEAEAARLAQVSMQELEQKLWRRYGNAGDGIRRSLYWQARAGVDSYISRHENLVELSSRVYKNLDLAMGRVEAIVNRGLLQGKGAREIAADVSKYINPNVPGGVRHAAMRLARTEINNAFHYTAIRYTREMPWVTGYKWNLSGSHPKPDICNEMAQNNHGAGDPGVYPKSKVPGKPHPHCFCFITTVTVTPERFASGMRAGRYDSYLSGFAG